VVTYDDGGGGSNVRSYANLCLHEIDDGLASFGALDPSRRPDIIREWGLMTDPSFPPILSTLGAAIDIVETRSFLSIFVGLLIYGSGDDESDDETLTDSLRSRISRQRERRRSRRSRLREC